MLIDYTYLHQSYRFDTLRAAAVLMWGDDGAWLYDTWAAHNTAYFGGSLRCGGLTWAPMHEDWAMGCYDTASGLIHMHLKFYGLNRTPYARGLAMVLLHEMIHQSVCQQGRNREGSSHNTPAWFAEVNRVAPLLGLPADAETLPYKMLATWPVCMFPQYWSVGNE